MTNNSKPARRRRRRLPPGMTTDWVEPDIESLRNSLRSIDISGEPIIKPRIRSSKKQGGNLEQCNEDYAEECNKAYEFLKRSLQDGNDLKEYDFDLFFGGVLTKMVLQMLKKGNRVNWTIISKLMERNSSKQNIYPYPPADNRTVMNMERSIIRMYYWIVSDPDRRHTYQYYIK